MANNDIVYKEPSRVIISAFKKRVSTNTTNSNIKNIDQIPRKIVTSIPKDAMSKNSGIFYFLNKRACSSVAMDHIQKPVISAFKKRIPTNKLLPTYTLSNSNKILAQSCSTAASAGNTVKSTEHNMNTATVFKKKVCTNDTVLQTPIKQNSIFEPKLLMQKDRTIENFPLKEKSSHKVNTTVSNETSTSEDDSFLKENPTSEENSLLQEKEKLTDRSMQNDNSVRVWSGPSKGKVPKMTNCSGQCRVCLKKGNLPIYGYNNDNLANTIMTITGVKLSATDSYPKCLCKPCLKLLLSAVLFRNTAQISDKLLKEPIVIDDGSEYGNNDEESKALEQHLISHTESIDHNITKLLDKIIEINPDPTQLIDNKVGDFSCNSDMEKIIREYLSNNMNEASKESKTEVKKIVNIVMPRADTIDKNNVNKNINKIIKLLPDEKLNYKINIVSSDSNMIDHLLQEYQKHLSGNSQKLPFKHSSRGELKNSLNQDISVYLKTPLGKKQGLEKIKLSIPNDDHNTQEYKSNLQNISGEKSTESIVIATDSIKNNSIQNIGQNETLEEFNTKQDIPEVFNTQHNFTEEFTFSDLESEKSSDTDDYFGDKYWKLPNLHEIKLAKLKRTKLPCLDCGVIHHTYKSLSEHYRDNHPERKNLQCTICKRTVVVRCLPKHMYDHDKAGLCEICGKLIPGVKNFNEHLRIHSKIFPWKCTLCDYRAKSKSTLKQHTVSSHSDKKYTCHLCPKKFNNTGNLRRHILVHEQKRAFVCSTCDKGFYATSDLKRHNNSVHLGIRRANICGICEMSFDTKKKRLQHQSQVHNRSKLPRHRVPSYIKMGYQENTPNKNNEN